MGKGYGYRGFGFAVGFLVRFGGGGDMIARRGFGLFVRRYDITICLNVIKYDISF